MISKFPENIQNNEIETRRKSTEVLFNEENVVNERNNLNENHIK